MSDLEQLKSMGFPPERASMALAAGGNLNGAIDWLEQNAEKSTEEIQEQAGAAAPNADVAGVEQGGIAKSWVCNECSKKFRNHGEMEFHANKSGHTDMAESAEEIAPLTEEERAAKLTQLRQKLATKRAMESEQDKDDKKKNEAIRRMATKESQDIREDLAKKEQIKVATQKRREKKADELARQKILQQIAQDKEDRKRKADAEKAARACHIVEQTPPSVPTRAVLASSQSSTLHTQTRLRIQLPTGNMIKTYAIHTTLQQVALGIKEESGLHVQTFTTIFPKKTYKDSDFNMTLEEAGMLPSAALLVG